MKIESKKWFYLIVVLIIAVGFLILIGYSQKLDNSTGDGAQPINLGGGRVQTIKTEEGRVALKDGTLAIYINGGIYKCVCTPGYSYRIIEFDDLGERIANTNSPEDSGKGNNEYFLDGQYYGQRFGMCDVVTCEKNKEPVEIRLVEFVKIGERMSELRKVPEYKTSPLRKYLEVEFNYCADEQLCNEPKTLVLYVDREGSDGDGNYNGERSIYKTRQCNSKFTERN